MRVIVPVPVTIPALVASELPGDDHAAWAAGTAYAVGARVQRDAAQSIYLVGRTGVTIPTIFEAVVAHTGRDPADRANVVGARLADGTKNTTGSWVRVGSTNRWKVFDGRVGDLSVRASGGMSWRISVTSLVNAVAVLRVTAATVRVRVFDAGATLVFEATETAVNTSKMTNLWAYLTEPPEVRRTLVVSGFAALPGQEIEITVSGEGTRRVGEIVLGRAYAIGRLLVDAGASYDDYSRIERDDFGGVDIIRRGFAETATFPLTLPGPDVERIRTLLTDIRGRPAVFHGGDDLTQHGLTVFGLVEAPPFEIRSYQIAYLNLEVKGLT